MRMGGRMPKRGECSCGGEGWTAHACQDVNPEDEVNLTSFPATLDPPDEDEGGTKRPSLAHDKAHAEGSRQRYIEGHAEPDRLQ